MLKSAVYDSIAASGVMAIFADMWDQWLTPLLHGITLLLGVTFLALGVALRWREYRRGGTLKGDEEC